MEGIMSFLLGSLPRTPHPAGRDGDMSENDSINKYFPNDITIRASIVSLSRKHSELRVGNALARVPYQKMCLKFWTRVRVTVPRE
jgi:hypothetical protein